MTKNRREVIDVVNTNKRDSEEDIRKWQSESPKSLKVSLFDMLQAKGIVIASGV